MGQSFTLSFILALLFIAYHVISILAQARARKLEQEKMREAAERRRREAGHFNPASYPTAAGPQTGVPGTPTLPSSGRHNIPTVPLPVDMKSGSGVGHPGTPAVGRPIRTGVPIDDLAARRKAQLEQLRNRRDIRKAAPARGSTQSAPQSAPDVLLPDVRRSADQDAARRAREEERKVREGQERAAKQRQLELKARRERAKRAQKIAQSSIEAETTFEAIPTTLQSRQSPAGGSRSQTARLLAGRLQNRNTLRELFVMKELLDRPVALRD